MCIGCFGVEVFDRVPQFFQFVPAVHWAAVHGPGVGVDLRNQAHPAYFTHAVNGLGTDDDRHAAAYDRFSGVIP